MTTVMQPQPRTKISDELLQTAFTALPYPALRAAITAPSCPASGCKWIGSGRHLSRRCCPSWKPGS